MTGEDLELDDLLKLRKTARQLLFRPKVEGIPVSLGGTFFLLKYEGHFFAVTAKHVVRGATNDQLLLTTTDRSFIPARILNRFDICDENNDNVDLVVYHLDIRHFTAKQRRLSSAYELNPIQLDTSLLRVEADFWFFGYPLAESTVDYGTRTTLVNTKQWYFEASYYRSSELKHCHVLKLKDRSDIPDLNGLSGSPVFANRQLLGAWAAPIFAGIVVRGNAESGIVHFLHANVVRTVLEDILLRIPKKLPKRWSGLKTRIRRSPRTHS